jgi:hypothetical protein
MDYKHVLLTSRPNALSRDLKRQFGRKIDCSSFDQKGVGQYIEKYYDNQLKASNALVVAFFIDHLGLVDASIDYFIQYFQCQGGNKDQELIEQLTSIISEKNFTTN